MVASMTEKPQIFGLKICMSKKQRSRLPLTVLFVLLLIFGLFCFSFLSFADGRQSSSFSEKDSLVWYSPSFEECNMCQLSSV